MDLAEAAELPDAEDERREDLIRVLSSLAMSELSDEDGHQVRLELALLHAEAHRTAEALELIREAHRSRPSLATARLWHELALRTGDREQLARALEAELSLASHDGTRAVIEIARGRAAEDAGDAEGALRAFLRAIGPGARIEAAWAAERIAASMGRWKEAADAAEQAARLTSHAEAAAEWIGRAARYRLLEGEREAAAALLRDAGGALVSPSIWLGRELLAAGADDATPWIDLRRAQLESAPSPETAVDAALMARYRLADDGLARAFLERALELAEGETRRFVLAELSELIDPATDLAAWTAHMEARLEGEPDAAVRAHLAARLARASAQLDGDLAAARERALRALDEDPLHGPSLDLCARIGREDDALVERLRAEAEAAPSAEWRAEALLERAERQGAGGLDALVEAEAALPADAGLFAHLERALEAKADHAALVDLRERALPQVKDPVLRFRLLTGIADACSRHLDQPERAAEALGQAARIDGMLRFSVEARRAMVGLLDGDARVEALRELMARDPSDDARYRAELVERLEAAGDDAGALEVLREGAAGAPPRHPLRRAAHRLYGRLAKSRERLALFDESAEAAEGEARARWLWRAADVCEWDLGQPDEAIARLREAAERSPGTRSLGVALRDLLARTRQLEALLAFDPGDDPHAALRRAAMLEATGDEAAASAEYARALDLGLPCARLGLERLLLRRGKHKELVGRWTAPPEGLAPERAARLRYRAAALAMERLSDAETARGLLDAILVETPAAIPALSLRLRHLPASDPARVAALEQAIDRVDDPALRRAAQRELAHRIDDPEEAVALWRAIALADPTDVVAAVRTSAGLERAGRTREQQDWVQAMTPPTDPELVSIEAIRSARRADLLGSLRAAADAFESALERPRRPFLPHLELPRLYELLDQPGLRESSLAQLAQRLPRGPLAARTSMVLAEALRERGDEAGALGQLERASIADPTYYPALSAIEALSHADPEPLIDALLRAFESEGRPEVLAPLGVHLGRLLYEADRVELAREVLERVVSIDPGHLPGHLWLAEVYEETGEADRLFDVLEAAAKSDDAPPELRERALVRRVDLALEGEDMDRVRAAADGLAAIAPDHPRALEATLTTALARGDHAEAAAVLEKLIARPELSETVRVGYLFELATVKAEKLGDVAAAIRALAEIRSPEAKEEAVRRLVELGDRSGRWDIASQALEAALDDAFPLERSWELTIRKRLATLFDGPLADREAAMRQRRRIVELDASDVDALAALLEVTEDPKEGTHLTRLLFAARPEDHTLLSRLRDGFLALGDEDAAFTVEGVAVGVGAASEEVEYFYRQRRTRLSSGPAARALTADELESFQAAEQAVPRGFLRALEPLLPDVLPPDFGAYGIDPAHAPELDAGFLGVVESVATCFGIEPPRTLFVAAQRGPAIEHHGGKPLLLVPRPLLDAPRREQRFVLGTMCYRVVTKTAWGDPCRADPLTAKYLQYVMAAAAQVLDGIEAPSGSPIQDDIRRRLDVVMGNAARDAAQAARAGLSLAEVDHDALLKSTDRAAAQAGMLVSRDPAAAMTALGRWRRLIRDDDAAERAVTGFAISEDHQALRTALKLGLV